MFKPTVCFRDYEALSLLYKATSGISKHFRDIKALPGSGEGGGGVVVVMVVVMVVVYCEALPLGLE